VAKILNLEKHILEPHFEKESEDWQEVAEINIDENLLETLSKTAEEWGWTINELVCCILKDQMKNQT